MEIRNFVSKTFILWHISLFFYAIVSLFGYFEIIFIFYFSRQSSNMRKKKEIKKYRRGLLPNIRAFKK